MTSVAMRLNDINEEFGKKWEGKNVDGCRQRGLSNHPKSHFLPNISFQEYIPNQSFSKFIDPSWSNSNDFNWYGSSQSNSSRSSYSNSSHSSWSNSHDSQLSNNNFHEGQFLNVDPVDSHLPNSNFIDSQPSITDSSKSSPSKSNDTSEIEDLWSPIDIRGTCYFPMANFKLKSSPTDISRTDGVKPISSLIRTNIEQRSSVFQGWGFNDWTLTREQIIQNSSLPRRRRMKMRRNRRFANEGSYILKASKKTKITNKRKSETLKLHQLSAVATPFVPGKILTKSGNTPVVKSR